MKKIMRYGCQTVDAGDARAVAKTVRSQWLTQGPRVSEFEKHFAGYCQAPYAVAVSNGTAALHLACLAAGIQKGSEAVTSPITFLASANAVLYAGGRPVFADVEGGSLNVDPRSAAAAITAKTRALIPVHYGGYSCDMRSLSKAAGRAAVIEDACHALGAEYRGRPVGSCEYSDMSVFSFHPVKSITTGEGGMITTRRKELYQTLLDLRSHGMVRGDRRKIFDEPWEYEMQSLGFNYRLTDIQSALGIRQLKKLPGFIRKRRALAEAYFEAFRGVSEVELPPPAALPVSAWHLFVIRFTGRDASSKRRYVYDGLARLGIQTQVHYMPVHLQPYYQRRGYRRGTCPVAEDAYSRILSLPIYPALSAADVRRVVSSIKKLLSEYVKKRIVR